MIVKFKADASALRRGILSAGPLAVPGGESAVAEAMQRRAEGIGQRHGIALRAGRVVDDRAQVVMADGITSAELARQLSADSDVEYAVVDERRHKLVVPNDPIYTAGPPGTGPDVGQWYLKPPSGDVKASIDAQTAWDIPNITTASANVVVGVLDTGVRYDHR
ncbi:MAG TPA: hypothetical protein VFP68_05700, partial [Burkholderiaceae bacterium]|nr:hypothetical protein [Burkholderiaceae bacterium]